MYEHSLQDEFWEMKRWGSPRVIWGQPKSFAFLYKYRRVRCREGIFPRYICESMLEEELFPFAIKNYRCPVGESLVEFFKCCAMDLLNVNYFVFSCYPLTVRLF